MMQVRAKKQKLSKSDLQRALDLLCERGMRPTACELLPDGTVKLICCPATGEPDLDVELHQFEIRHGYRQA